MFCISDKIRKNVLVSTDQGLMIVNRFDCNNEQVGQGQWLLDHGSVSSVEASETYKNLTERSNPVILDIGANIGTYTTWLAKILPNSTIHCFEPQRSVFQILCGNIAINNYDNCFTYHMAVGNTNGFIELQEPDYYSKNDFGLFSLVKDKFGNKSGIRYTIPIVSVDMFVKNYGIDQIDFIKIDAEGMDLEVLTGASETIKRFKPCLLVEHSDNTRSILDDIVSFIDPFNYVYAVIGNNVLAKPI